MSLKPGTVSAKGLCVSKKVHDRKAGVWQYADSWKIREEAEGRDRQRLDQEFCYSYFGFIYSLHI